MRTITTRFYSAPSITAVKPAEPDPALLESAKAGAPGAFDQLYRNFRGHVYRQAFYIVKNHAEAEDVTQETFIKLMSKIGSYQEKKGKFSGWLGYVVRNLVFDRRDKAASRDRTKNQASITSQLQAQPAYMDPQHLTRMREGCDRLVSTLMQLADKGRLSLKVQKSLQAWILKELGGMDYSEIGESLGLKPSTARARAYEGGMMFLGATGGDY